MGVNLELSAKKDNQFFHDYIFLSNMLCLSSRLLASTFSILGGNLWEFEITKKLNGTI